MPSSKRAGARPVGLTLLGLGLLVWCWAAMIAMPGPRRRGPLQPPTPAQRRLAAELRRDVERLASEIGARNLHSHPDALMRAADFIEAELRAAGLSPARHCWDPESPLSCNIEAELRGRREIVVVGAHYDSVNSPGADDNASGVAAMLALARGLAQERPAHPFGSIRFVAFANEEAPYSHSEAMGSLAYARRCRARGERVAGMMSIESIGYYSDRPGTQRYPAPVGWFYPSTGDFVALVSDLGSRRLLRRAVASFRRATALPSEGGALPAALPGIGWSDHWAFWQAGYEAIMVTDTVPFRNPHYHQPSDLPDTLDYDRMAQVVAGLRAVILEWAEAAR